MNDKNGEVGRLYPDMAALRESGVIRDSIRDTGAVLMGRHTYDMGQGDYTDYEYQVPIFVVTHKPPAAGPKGESGAFKFNFVMDGVVSAVEKAKAAAGEKQVTVVGGANLSRQIIKAGLFDELELSLVPILLGEGLRFFDELGTLEIGLEKVSTLEAGGMTHLRYRVKR